jgi:hypothetical protein
MEVILVSMAFEYLKLVQWFYNFDSVSPNLSKEVEGVNIMQTNVFIN